MAALIEVVDLQDGYSQVIRRVILDGSQVAPRGQGTTELTDVTLVVRDPGRAVPLGVGRNLNLAIGCAETCALIGGLSDAGQMRLVTKNFAPFIQADALAGAYGPRLYYQLPRTAYLLASEPDTRQAVVTIWRPEVDTLPDVTDRPCTLGLQFKVRDGKLELHTTMRSNDVWLGLPYDAWMFTRLQHAMAWAIGRPVGPYTHSAGSLHLYDRDRPKVSTLTRADCPTRAPIVPAISLDGGPSHPDLAVDRWELVQLACEGAVLGRETALARAYANVLSEYVTGNQMCERCRYVLPARRWFIRNHNECRACGHGLTQLQYQRFLEERRSR